MYGGLQRGLHERCQLLPKFATQHATCRVTLCDRDVVGLAAVKIGDILPIDPVASLRFDEGRTQQLSLAHPTSATHHLHGGQAGALPARRPRALLSS